MIENSLITVIDELVLGVVVFSSPIYKCVTNLTFFETLTPSSKYKQITKAMDKNSAAAVKRLNLSYVPGLHNNSSTYSSSVEQYAHSYLYSFRK